MCYYRNVKLVFHLLFSQSAPLSHPKPLVQPARGKVDLWDSSACHMFHLGSEDSSHCANHQLLLLGHYLFVHQLQLCAKEEAASATRLPLGYIISVCHTI